MAARSLRALIILIFVFNIFKTSVRGPVVALMPDTIPGDYRSEANGVINMMGGIGLIVGTMVLARLMDISEKLPFAIAAGGIIVAVLILFAFVREGQEQAKEETKVPLLTSIKEIFFAPGQAGGKPRDSSVPRILFSLFFWFMAYEGAKPFLGLYLVDSLKTAESNAALAQGLAGISSVILAIPTGYFAHRMGRKKFIRLCLILLAIVLTLVPVSGAVILRLGGDAAGVLTLFLILMFLYGALWIGVVVNSFPMLWQMANFGNIGVYTGLYYTFSQSAAILAPPITGAIIDLGGYPGIFIFGSLCMIAAWVVMGGVSAGEAAGK
jgi:MFS family permease